VFAEPTDDLGPVDFLVVELPRGHVTFTDEMTAVLGALVGSGAIRLLDLLVVRKDRDGTVEALEIDDLDQAGDLAVLDAEVAEILAATDVTRIACAMNDDTAAGIVVWENRWAAPFVTVVGDAGGQLVATGRIPVQAIVDSLDADATSPGPTSTGPAGDDGEPPAARAAHRGVLAAPVARSVALAGTAAAVAAGVDRRRDRRRRRRDAQGRDPTA